MQNLAEARREKQGHRLKGNEGEGLPGLPEGIQNRDFTAERRNTGDD